MKRNKFTQPKIDTEPVIFCIENKKYKRVPQPEDSWENIPCYDCCFGENGECNAPKEILDSDLECGFVWSGTAYVYEEVNEA